jgi:spore germination cell wall hydrolase CwlJ-like protein
MRLISDEALGTLTIWQEAEGESQIGKQAVAEVIQRRARIHYNSDGSIAGTVARRYQFSGWNDDAQDNARLIASLELDDDDPVVAACQRAWRDAQLGVEVVPGATLYYRDGSPVPSWAAACVLIGKIGSHLFFKEAP